MLTIIIVNYNSLDYLYKNLKSISDSNLSDIKYEIIIIDNNSYKKPDQNKLLKFNAKLFLLDDNFGYSKALNYGVKYSSGKYILALNPDILLKSNTIINLYNYYKDNDIGVVGPKILNIDGTFQVSSRRRFPFIKNILPLIINGRKKYNYLDYDNNIIKEVDSISGSCMLFSKKIYDKVKGFDEQFFLYFEDTDFCLRVKELGYKVIYFPATEAFHFKYGSRKINNYLLVKFEFYKSFIKFTKKYLSSNF